MKTHYMTLSLLSISLLFNACTEKENESALTETAMKCGAGKCGASMVNGSTLLIKKKGNILNQMTDTDSRRECVINAPSTKALYNCVRDYETGRLSIEPGDKPFETVKKESPKKMLIPSKCESGKCGSGKCGSGM